MSITDPMMCECESALSVCVSVFHFLAVFSIPFFEGLLAVCPCCEALLDSKSTETNCNKNDISLSLCPLLTAYLSEFKPHL